VTIQANYCFNVVAANRPAKSHRQPRAFAGTADQFAQAMLDDVMSGDPRLAGEFVFVNVWDAGGGVHWPAGGRSDIRHFSRMLAALTPVR
jgi:hypothetical protein